MAVIDSVVLWYFRRRLARCRRPGDAVDRFADRVVALLSQEIERRNRLHIGWDAELRARDNVAAERLRRDLALQQFQVLTPKNRIQLQ